MKAVGRFEILAGVALLSLAGATPGIVLLGKPRPLAVVDTNPRPGAAEVRVETQLTVTFSRPIDETSVQAALSVTPRTEGLVSAAGRRAAFTPTGGFRADTEYAVTLGAGVRDRTGRPLREPVIIRFHTRGQRLVVRTRDGHLLKTPPPRATQTPSGPRGGEVAGRGPGGNAHRLPPPGTVVGP